MEDYKYLTIVEWAKDYITSNGLKPKDRFLTEKELCEIHGVSRQTVRQALMCLENENVISRVRGSGAFVSTGFAQPTPAVQARNIGVISTYFTDYIFPQIVTGIESVLNDSGYSMQLAITHNKVAEEQQALQSMISSGVQGLIIEPSKSALPNPNMELYDELKKKNIPVVFFNAKYPWSSYPCVSIDDEAAGRLAADYAFGCGHRRIAGICARDDIQGHKRYSGFAKSCETAAQGKCTVKTGKLSASYVRTDRNALRLLLLSFVRRHILGAESGKAAFFIECGENAKNLEIKITASGTFVDVDDFGQPDVFSGYHSQVCMGLAERAGASAVVDNGSLTVAIPLAYGNSEPVAEAPAPEHESGFFDAFNIMLRDLSERK